MMRVLVVDDDDRIREGLRRQLGLEAYTVNVAADAEEALEQLSRNMPDLIVLDWMLPGMSGLDACRRIRQMSNVPILILTAKGTLGDKVDGLDSGADDYLVKPFQPEELLARVRALLRRRQPQTAPLKFGVLVLDPAARQVTSGSIAVELSSKEFDLLELFMRSPRQVLSRETIYDRVWGYDFSGESNILEVYIRYLRSKLEATGAPRYIQTVRGVGYVLREDNHSGPISS